MSTINNPVHSYISDAALVLEAKNGNHSAFEELCRHHSANLARRIRRILVNPFDAEDVLQETLLKAFTHLKSFEGRSSVSTWLTRIAINAAFSRLREKRYTMIPIDDTGEDSQESQAWVLRDDSPDPESRLIQRQKETLLAEGIRRLPPRLRCVIELRLKRGYSGREIADKLGITESAVKSRLLRAQARLQSRDRVRESRGGRLTVANYGMSRA